MQDEESLNVTKVACDLIVLMLTGGKMKSNTFLTETMIVVDCAS